MVDRINICILIMFSILLEKDLTADFCTKKDAIIHYVPYLFTILSQYKFVFQ